MTVNVAPAMVNVPVRLDAIVFAPTLNPTVLLPDPVAPLVTVIHAALLAAVHGRPVEPLCRLPFRLPRRTTDPSV